MPRKASASQAPNPPSAHQKGAHPPAGAHHGAGAERARTVNRLRRIEGQIAGLARMVEDDRYCIDILTQIQAAKAALSKVEDKVLADHAAHCVASAIRSGDADNQRAKFAELVALFGKVKR